MFVNLVGHIGLEGHEKADEQVSEETCIPVIGPEPACGINKFLVKLP